MTTMRRLALVVAVVIASAALAQEASAHAKLVRADPAPNSTVAAVPKVVRLWFSEELTPKGSTVTVVDARGRRVDDGKGRLDLDDMDRRIIVAGLKPLVKGKYTVRWKAVSADDLDVAQGSFNFVIR
jgi:methionine-rich copper-binding protein CopC